MRGCARWLGLLVLVGGVECGPRELEGGDQMLARHDLDGVVFEIHGACAGRHSPMHLGGGRLPSRVVEGHDDWYVGFRVVARRGGDDLHVLSATQSTRGGVEDQATGDAIVNGMTIDSCARGSRAAFRIREAQGRYRIPWFVAVVREDLLVLDHAGEEGTCAEALERAPPMEQLLAAREEPHHCDHLAYAGLSLAAFQCAVGRGFPLQLYEEGAKDALRRHVATDPELANAVASRLMPDGAADLRSFVCELGSNLPVSTRQQIVDAWITVCATDPDRCEPDVPGQLGGSLQEASRCDSLHRLAAATPDYDREELGSFQVAALTRTTLDCGDRGLVRAALLRGFGMRGLPNRDCRTDAVLVEPQRCGDAASIAGGYFSQHCDADATRTARELTSPERALAPSDSRFGGSLRVLGACDRPAFEEVVGRLDPAAAATARERYAPR